MVEKWKSREAFEAHLASPNLLAYNDLIKDRVANVTIYVLSPQEGI